MKTFLENRTDEQIKRLEKISLAISKEAIIGETFNLLNNETTNKVLDNLEEFYKNELKGQK